MELKENENGHLDQSELNEDKDGENAKDPKKDKNNIDFVNDVPLEVQVELGKINLSLKDLLSLKKGTVLEMEKLAGEPLEILIRDKIICRGEVIVINEKYGIRMTDIVKPTFMEVENA